jgi:phosphodiesterase/alkaline phosphatase D-like protein
MPTATPLPLSARKLPYLVMTGDPASLKVCWQFETPTDAVLDWGTDESYTSESVAIPAAAVDGPTCVLMTGLHPGTHYLYRLSSLGSAFFGSFTTAPAEEDADLVFWGYGDTQANPEVHDAIAAAILDEMDDNPKHQTFVFDAGDIMDEASEDSLQANEFDQQWPDIVLLSSRVPVVNAMGNHDGTLLFLKYYPYPYTDTFDWSFD